jgi:hypothetical protein
VLAEEHATDDEEHGPPRAPDAHSDGRPRWPAEYELTRSESGLKPEPANEDLLLAADKGLPAEVRNTLNRALQALEDRNARATSLRRREPDARLPEPDLKRQAGSASGGASRPAVVRAEPGAVPQSSGVTLGLDWLPRIKGFEKLEALWKSKTDNLSSWIADVRALPRLPPLLLPGSKHNPLPIPLVYAGRDASLSTTTASRISKTFISVRTWGKCKGRRTVSPGDHSLVAVAKGDPGDTLELVAIWLVGVLSPRAMMGRRTGCQLFALSIGKGWAKVSGPSPGPSPASSLL